jgi:hypothetical protein
VINGANVSLKAYKDIDVTMNQYISEYELRLIDKNGDTEILSGQDMAVRYNEKFSKDKLYPVQKPFLWLCSLFTKQKYNVKSVYFYDNDKLDNLVGRLACLNKICIKPQNVSFRYDGGAYQAVEEIYGNMINKKYLKRAIITAILQGNKELKLDEEQCYINPNYTLSSVKTGETLEMLNKYVSTKITFCIGDQYEVLDGDIIRKWITISDELEVTIDNTAILNYVMELSMKYDTVGKVRSFKASSNKTIEVKGGQYGWKINQRAEIKAITESITKGTVIEREPIYSQTALSRSKNDIGDTYIEISITRQHLWFYKKGKLICEGAVVTGNPNKGNSTARGTFMIMYKQNLATLSGANYEVKVTYWMPFYGNMGIHDARWRHSFGGVIYKRNGTHGCVNAPYHLAEKLYENVEEGIPVICYEE